MEIKLRLLLKSTTTTKIVLLKKRSQISGKIQTALTQYELKHV